MRFLIATLVFCLATACGSKTKTDTTNGSKDTPPAAKPATTPAVTKAAEKSGEATALSSKAECSNKGDARVLELRTKGKGCELAYTKNGQEGIVASSGNGTQHCEATMNKIRVRLKGAGFDCK